MIAFDLETHKVQPGLLAPPIVCGSFFIPDAHIQCFVENYRYTLEYITSWLRSDALIAGFNVAYDFGCLVVADPSLLPLVITKYERGEVFDVMIAQYLDAIYHGYLRDEFGNKCIIDPRTGGPLKHPKTGKQFNRYSLEIVTDINLGRVDAKANDRFRLSYALLEGIPISEWPEEARQYPLDDAKNTYDNAVHQLASFKNLQDMPYQARAAFALHLGSLWGLRADPSSVKVLKEWTDWLHEGATEYFASHGFFKEDGKENGRALKRALIAAHSTPVPCGTCQEGKIPSPKTGNPVNCPTCDGTALSIPVSCPRTDSGRISISRDSLAESGDDALETYAVYGPNNKYRSTYIPFVEQAAKTPVNLSSNVLLSTGRVSYDGLVQLLPRKGGIRECCRARPGYVYCSVDYAAIEMSTLAQVCLWVVGWSRLAEAINADRDAHCDLAELLTGIPYAELLANKNKEPYKDYRFACKAGNFGFGGMMSEPTWVISKRKEGIRPCILMGGKDCGAEKLTEWKGREVTPCCKACVLQAAKLRKAWFTKWAEMPHYFNKISAMLDKTGGAVRQFVSNRVRGNCSGPAAANTLFQGLAADGAKRALWKITKEAYLDTQSPLYGSRLVVFAHDETFMELPEERMHEAAMRQCELMVEGMKEVVPDVKVKAEPALSYVWSKDAEPVYENGKLVPWRPAV